MAKKVKLHSPFKFDGFMIVESSILRKPIGKEGEFQFKIHPSGIIHEQKKVYELILQVNVFEENKRFDANIKALGMFSFKDVTKLEDLSDYFYVNAPAIIFPYIRSYISALTALSGMETINLPSIVMGSFKNELKKNTVSDIQEVNL